MPSSTPPWRLGLQPDINAEEVYQPFRDLLRSHLPMTQEELATEIGRVRTTVNRWKSERAAEWKAGLTAQRKVLRAVRERLEAIERQAGKVEEMIEALAGVGAAQEEHTRKFSQENLAALKKANDQVRDLLKPR